MLILAVISHVHPWQTVLLGGGICFLTLFFIHLISGGRMGLGDAKLYMSIGMMLGPWYGLLSLAFAATSGTVVGLLMRATSLVGKQEWIPFVPYICIGVVLAVFYGHPFVAWYGRSVLLLH